MSLKLVLDCSAPTLFIGYIYGDNLKIYSFAEAKHSITLFPLIEQILAENGFNVLDISDVYCVVGPGSFTGVRIGVSAANAMGLKDSVNLYPINKLDVLAYKNIECDRLSLIDAKHGNYYYGAYKKGEYFAFNTDECDTSFKRQYYTEVKICDTEIDADEYADLLINFVKNAPQDVLDKTQARIDEINIQANAIKELVASL